VGESTAFLLNIQGRRTMKLVLSRKGFDSSYGGMPSPILPDGRLVPLPIPTRHDRYTFADVNLPDIDVGGLVADLSRGRYKLGNPIHLDPDLDRRPAVRLPGWRPAFGQTDNAQSHLRDMGVGVGDVFLFFGWFREVARSGGMWRYAKCAPHLHVIFGWIEVAEVLSIVRARERCLREFPWIADHPHVLLPDHYSDPRNTLYVAAPESRFSRTAAHGGGRFLRYASNLRLTMSNATRSVWSLPMWFMPKNGRAPLSYHSRPNQWQHDGDRVILHSAAQGQEFVLDGSAYTEVNDWVASLVKEKTSP
jgi:hypothetical protein